jgi:uncharacterized protein (DUF2141 family)
MFNIKHLAVVAAILASGAASAASSVTLGTGTIAAASTLTFGVDVGATPSATFTGVIRGTTVIGDIFSFSLYDSLNNLVSGSPFNSISPTFKKESFQNTYTNLAAGHYTVKLVSGINGGAYSVTGSYNLPTSPVPEPLTMVLSLAGAAVVLAKRRKPQ